jgi:hypothetical protein
MSFKKTLLLLDSQVSRFANVKSISHKWSQKRNKSLFLSEALDASGADTKSAGE